MTLTPSPLPLRGRGAIDRAKRAGICTGTPYRPSPAQRERGGGEGCATGQGVRDSRDAG